MNSFFLRDLERVRRACLSNAVGDALRSYLMPDHTLVERRRDVREPASLSTLLEILDPARFPIGAWPSKDKHPLVFSQQIAVNEIYQQLDKNAGLFAVNGPPGTGKTTLLRDVVASVIVERAKLIADGVPFFSSHAEFAWDKGRFPAAVAPIDRRYHGFEIVVASSNNGAVENVTMEIPGSEAVDSTWLTDGKNPDYFPTLASAILTAAQVEDGLAGEKKEPFKAWAMLAAPLGNSTNRGRFAYQFWLQKPSINNPKPDTTGATAAPRHNVPPMSFRYLLGDEEAFPDFAKTKKKFVDACRTEAQIRSTVIAVRDAHTSILAVEQEVISAQKALDTAKSSAHAVATGEHPTLRNLSSMLMDAQERLTDATKLHEAAQARHGEAEAKAARCAAVFGMKKTRLSVYKQQAPSLRRIICTFGYALFTYRKMLGRYQASEDRSHLRSRTYKVIAERLRTELSDAAAEQKQCTAHQRVAMRELDEFCMQIERAVSDKAEALDEVISLLAKHKAALATFQHNYPNQYPDFAVLMQDPAAREKSSLWLTSEWYDARCKVFLTALELHKAYIGANRDTFLSNLSAMTDVLMGAAPPAPAAAGAVADAWRTLFFVVPVLSTTFASFDRLFSHLGRESLGWLLVDEAGQAPPQAVAGALWRSLRAVIVGDPLQLEPIVPVPYPLQKAVQKYPSFELDDSWLPGKTSVQRRADATMTLGTFLRSSRNSADALWVGAPLRVHRRCDDPMFKISNEIAYGNMMVFGKKRLDKPHSVSGVQTSWIDVPFFAKGESNCNPQEIDAVKRVLQTLSNSEHVDVTKDVFLLSPFRDTAEELTSLGKQFKISSKRAGTIHTAQGKEADIVILALGGSTVNARKWAAETPNLLNVAATRAKRILVVIGSRQNWASLEYFNTASEQIQQASEGMLLPKI